MNRLPHPSHYQSHGNIIDLHDDSRMIMFEIATIRLMINAMILIMSTISEMTGHVCNL